MVGLQKDLEAIEEAGIEVIGISYDSPETLKKFSEKFEVKFRLLSDPESRVIDKFALRNKQARKGSRQDGIPHPVTIVVDGKGIVRAKLAYDVRKRHTTKELIEAVQKLKEE